VIGAEQAVMGQAQRLRQRHGIRGGPDLVQHGQDRSMLAPEIVGLPCQPRTDAQRERRVRVERRQNMLEPRLQ
jgi:hypothetical protein